jgi:hypothetical protein
MGPRIPMEIKGSDHLMELTEAMASRKRIPQFPCGGSIDNQRHLGLARHDTKIK